MDEKDTKPPEFQVVDKRQFTADGEPRAEAPAETEPPPAAAAGPGGLPPASFAELVFSLAATASMLLGDVPDPATGQAKVDLPVARHYIDLLVLMEEKTRGNLQPDEAQLIRHVLTELQLRYVGKAQAPPAP
jgi:hypothetical protein